MNEQPMCPMCSTSRPEFVQELNDTVSHHDQELAELRGMRLQLTRESLHRPNKSMMLFVHRDGAFTSRSSSSASG